MPTPTKLDKTALKVVNRLLGTGPKSLGKDVIVRVPDSNAAYNRVDQRMETFSATLRADHADNSLNVVPGGVTPDFVSYPNLALGQYIHISGAGKNIGTARIVALSSDKLTLDRTLVDETIKMSILAYVDFHCKGYIVDASIAGMIGVELDEGAQNTTLINLTQIGVPIANEKNWIYFDGGDPATAAQYNVTRIVPLYSGQDAPIGFLYAKRLQ